MLPSKLSRPTSNSKPIECSWSNRWKAWLSCGPAPSFIMPARSSPVPGRVAWSITVAPPRNAMVMERIGLAWFSTSQASMPPGLTTRTTSTAARAGSVPRQSSRAKPSAARRCIMCCSSTGRLGPEFGGDGDLVAEQHARRLVHLRRRDLPDPLGPCLQLLDVAPGHQRRADQPRRRLQTVAGKHGAVLELLLGLRHLLIGHA